MAKCERHIWDTQDKEWCWKCDELTDQERIKNLQDFKIYKELKDKIIELDLKNRIEMEDIKKS